MDKPPPKAVVLVPPPAPPKPVPGLFIPPKLPKLVWNAGLAAVLPKLNPPVLAVPGCEVPKPLPPKPVSGAAAEVDVAGAMLVPDPKPPKPEPVEAGAPDPNAPAPPPAAGVVPKPPKPVDGCDVLVLVFVFAFVVVEPNAGRVEDGAGADWPKDGVEVLLPPKLKPPAPLPVAGAVLVEPKENGVLEAGWVFWAVVPPNVNDIAMRRRIKGNDKERKRGLYKKE